MHRRQSARPRKRELPLRLRPADLRARASRIAWSADALHAEGDRTADGAYSLGRGTFGPGTIIGGPGRRYGHLAVLRADPPDPRETGRIGDLRLREISVFQRKLELSAAPTTAHLMSGSPPWCACLRPGLSSGAFGLLTAPLTASTDGSTPSGHMPLGAGGYKVEFDVSVDGFPEQGRQMSP